MSEITLVGALIAVLSSSTSSAFSGFSSFLQHDHSGNTVQEDTAEDKNDDDRQNVEHETNSYLSNTEYHIYDLISTVRSCNMPDSQVTRAANMVNPNATLSLLLVSILILKLETARRGRGFFAGTT